MVDHFLGWTRHGWW